MGKLISITRFIRTASFGLLGSAALAAEPPVAEVPEIKPSRYAGEDVEAYIQTLSAAFSSKDRTLDPFGQNQDPEAKPVVRRPLSTAAPAIPAVPFPEIISLIKITAIMAGEKRFLVGSRSIAQGDQFPLPFRGETLRVQVTEVSARQVAFKNLATGEIAAQVLNLLPSGMTPGSSGLAAPGMTPAGADAPLQIESDPAAAPAR